MADSEKKKIYVYIYTQWNTRVVMVYPIMQQKQWLNIPCTLNSNTGETRDQICAPPLSAFLSFYHDYSQKMFPDPPLEKTPRRKRGRLKEEMWKGREQANKVKNTASGWRKCWKWRRKRARRASQERSGRKRKADNNSKPRQSLF